MVNFEAAWARALENHTRQIEHLAEPKSPALFGTNPKFLHIPKLRYAAEIAVGTGPRLAFHSQLGQPVKGLLTTEIKDGGDETQEVHHDCRPRGPAKAAASPSGANRKAVFARSMFTRRSLGRSVLRAQLPGCTSQ